MEQLAPLKDKHGNESEVGTERVKIEVLNIPGILQFDNQTLDYVLKNDDGDDLKMILSTTIKALIEYKGTSYAKDAVYWQLKIHLILLITFFFYTIFLTIGSDTEASV